MLIIALVVVAVGNFLLSELGHLGLHMAYRRKARKVLEKVRTLDAPGQKIQFLRRINPFVFEELILLAFEQRGCPAERNRSYTGDGGIDGAVIIDKEKILLQDKRYGKYIKPRHVEAFEKVCAKKGFRGLFVHSGKTGKDSRRRACASQRVAIISGQKLLSLIEGEGKIHLSDFYSD